MKNTFRKTIVVLCLSAVMSLGLCFGVTGLLPVGAATSTKYDVTEIEDSYMIDTSVVVSDTPDATKTVFPKNITIDSVTATANTIKYPDGYERAIGDSFELDQLGKYTITYKAGTDSYYFDTFCVINKFSDITGDGDLKPYEVDDTINGVTAVMNPGSSILFNKVIDLTQVDPETGCVDLFSAVFNVKNKETSEIYVRYVEMLFEDVNDPDVFIKVRLWVSNIGYFRVETKDLPDSGLLPTSEKEVLGATDSGLQGLICYINGVRYKNFFGTAGSWWRGFGVNHIIRYNPSTQQLFHEVNGDAHSDSKIFADLDNIDAWYPGSKFFTGFPSNAVKLTISGTEHINTFTMDITQIGDSKGEDLYNLIENGIKDDKAPQITLNAEATSAGTVYGKFGSKFVIPTATAVDANDPSPVSVMVYKNYVDTSKVYVPLEEDGTLHLKENAVYTIEYTSYDKYGNVAKEILNVVPKTTTPISGYDVMIDSNIQLGFNKIALVAGEKCNANVYEVLKTINSQDALSLTVDVTHAGKSVFNKTYTANDIKAEELKFDFLPISIGDYVITYTYSDNVESDSSIYTVKCTSNNVKNFKEAPFLYRNYMYGMKYDLSSHVAYQFGETLQPEKEDSTTVEISYDDGATWTAVNSEDKTFVVGADVNGNVPLTQSVFNIKFRYTCGSRVQITDSAPIVDVRRDTSRELSFTNKEEGNIDYIKYFVADEFDITSTPQERYLFDAKTTSGSATLRTINPVTFNKNANFETSFTTYTEYDNFSKITISLVDAYDSTNKLNFYIELIQGETMVSVDGSRKYSVTNFPLFNTKEGENSSKLDLTFKVSSQRLTACGKQFVVDFHPTNNLFYVEYTLSGISGTNAAILLTSVSNVAIKSTSIYDNVSPVFCYESSAGTYALGTTVTIFSPQVTDFVTPYIHEGHTTFKVTVNNECIWSVDGTKLDGMQDPTRNYDILISDLSIYKVTYKVVDDANRSDTHSYNIQGADKVNPVITLGYDFNENTIHNVTLGKPFTIDYTITDDVSPTESCYGRVVIINDATLKPIYAVEPMEYAEDPSDYTLITDTCTITVKGMYTVYVYARDEAGNTVYSTYKLNVQ